MSEPHLRISMLMAVPVRPRNWESGALRWVRAVRGSRIKEGCAGDVMLGRKR
jgi:hypothetical protein